MWTASYAFRGREERFLDFLVVLLAEKRVLDEEGRHDLLHARAVRRHLHLSGETPGKIILVLFQYACCGRHQKIVRGSNNVEALQDEQRRIWRSS